MVFGISIKQSGLCSVSCLGLNKTASHPSHGGRSVHGRPRWWNVRVPVRTIGYIAEVCRDGILEGVSASRIVVSCPVPQVYCSLQGCCDSTHVPTLNTCPSIRVLKTREQLLCVHRLKLWFSGCRGSDLRGISSTSSSGLCRQVLERWMRTVHSASSAADLRFVNRLVYELCEQICHHVFTFEVDNGNVHCEERLQILRCPVPRTCNN